MLLAQTIPPGTTEVVSQIINADVQRLLVIIVLLIAIVVVIVAFVMYVVVKNQSKSSQSDDTLIRELVSQFGTSQSNFQQFYTKTTDAITYGAETQRLVTEAINRNTGAVQEMNATLRENKTLTAESFEEIQREIVESRSHMAGRLDLLASQLQAVHNVANTVPGESKRIEEALERARSEIMAALEVCLEHHSVPDIEVVETPDNNEGEAAA